MRRMGMAIGVKPEKLAEYKALHASPWPEMDAALKDASISNYSIHLCEARMMLFGYWEYHGADFAADMARLGALDVTRRWLSLTDACQTPLGDATGWTFLEQVYCLT